jgi:hypothetical protein
MIVITGGSSLAAAATFGWLEELARGEKKCPREVPMINDYSFEIIY